MANEQKLWNNVLRIFERATSPILTENELRISIIIKDEDGSIAIDDIYAKVQDLDTKEIDRCLKLLEQKKVIYDTGHDDLQAWCYKND